MSEIWIALAALAVGVLLGLVIRRNPVRGRAQPATRDHVREVLNAADDLEYALTTVLNFGPLSTSELVSVDLPAKLDRLAATGLDRATLRDLRTHTERIALHPYPEPRDLLSAVREDDASVWLVLREAVGSGAAQHQAAANARECLAVIRAGLREAAPREIKELVPV